MVVGGDDIHLLEFESFQEKVVFEVGGLVGYRGIQITIFLFEFRSLFLYLAIGLL